MKTPRHTLLALACLLSAGAFADEGNSTVIGPRNLDLFDGAQSIMNGDAEEGVRLTLRGLEYAVGDREIDAALSNLCGGYLLLKDFGNALHYCNLALERNTRNWRALNNRALVHIEQGEFNAARNDLDSGFEINPSSRTLKKAEQLLHEKMNPVTPNISIDDRQPDEST